MRVAFALIAIAFVAACGADGEPVRPSMKSGATVSPTGSRTSISISGEARIGWSWDNL